MGRALSNPVRRRLARRVSQQDSRGKKVSVLLWLRLKGYLKRVYIISVLGAAKNKTYPLLALVLISVVKFY